MTPRDENSNESQRSAEAAARSARSLGSIALLATAAIGMIATSYRNVTPGSALPVAVTMAEGEIERRVTFVARYDRAIQSPRTPFGEIEVQVSRASEALSVRIEPSASNAANAPTPTQDTVVQREATLSASGYGRCASECSLTYTVVIRRVGNDTSTRTTFALQALTRFANSNWEPPAGTRVVTTLAPAGSAP